MTERTVTVVVPVKDGERYLGELLRAVFDQAGAVARLDVLVVDSGSADGSAAIARAAGAEVLEIAPEEFGHGRTRNLAAERATGEIVAFLTQDATPVPGWLAAIAAGFDADPDVGAVYGPHLARPDTSPMIARELAEFFAGHGPADGPTIQRAGDEPYLSNVNAAYRRDVWAELRFDDVPYSEDQAFARALLAAGYAKAFHPDAAVLHAHDYPPVDFMRRYFDEYRGLRQTIGHVERVGLRSSVRTLRAGVGGDLRWMRERGVEGAEQRRWLARSALHHAGRRAFSALGSHGHALPASVQRRISLEGTVAPPPPPPPVWPVPSQAVPARPDYAWEAVLDHARDGAAPLLEPLPGQETDLPLHIACVIPPFRRGSGGHNSIFQLLTRLERAGHTVSVWLDDPLGEMREIWPSYVRTMIRDWFAPLEGPVFKGFDDWYGADVAIATGWQTVHRTVGLERVRARAYLVHDHETEFLPTSAEAIWAEETYGLGLHAICASPWLADIVRDRYGGTTSTFDFGVDHEVYRPQPVARRRDTIVVYGRDVTPRRAVPLALLALQELTSRRPEVRVECFGNPSPIATPFPHRHLGVLAPEELAWAYSQATIGLVLSLTNYSLIPQEMLACGLPCVDLAGISAESVFGPDGPVALTDPNPLALADAMERLLDDRDGEWAARSQAGLDFVRDRTWDRAAHQVEGGLREAVRLRQAETAGAAAR